MANNYGPTPESFKGDPYSGDSGVQGIEFSSPGPWRELDDAREEKGVYEGISTTAAEGVDTNVETFSPRNS